MSFRFRQEQDVPLPRWMGPFSSARGTNTGFRFHQDRLGTWVVSGSNMAFWPVVDCQGARDIAALVRRLWRGGRVLLLPNGFVVKPLQHDTDIGQRLLLGRFKGSIRLEREDRPAFDMSNPGALTPGDKWFGPATTGLECVIQSDGLLTCTWYHPTRLGRDEVSAPLSGPNRSLADGFRLARPGNAIGRVRVTANGHVITNRSDTNGDLIAVWVGKVDTGLFTGWDKWIERRKL